MDASLQTHQPEDRIIRHSKPSILFKRSHIKCIPLGTGIKWQNAIVLWGEQVTN